MNPLAFPRTAFNTDGDITTFDADFNGMTLRDYFAAKAMQSFCTGLSDIEGYNSKGLAIMAYEMADAMLKERAKECLKLT